MTPYLMYRELASWWHLLSSPDDYAEEVGFFWKVLAGYDLPASPSLLELGCGGGNNALHMKKFFGAVTLTDVSPDMLQMSARLNPDCEHIEGDMRTLRLGRVYDVVFIHDAIDYMLTSDDLRRAIATAAQHCRSGGVALLVPDHVAETLRPSTDHGGHDGQGRSMRYLEWLTDPDPTDTQCTTDYVYLLKETDRPDRVEHESHVHGLFPRQVWLDLMRDEGFDTAVITDPFERDLFVGRRTA